MGLFESLNLTQHVDEPNYIIYGHTDNYVVTKKFETSLLSVNVSYLISVHHVVHCTINLNNYSRSKNRLFTEMTKPLIQMPFLMTSTL